MEVKEADIKRLLSNSVIKMLVKLIDKTNVLLVGGAIIDILDHVQPKDYDLLVDSNYKINSLIDRFEKAGFENLVETKRAITFKAIVKKETIIIQILKRKSIDEFSFTVQRSHVNLRSNAAKIDPDYLRKRLTPINFNDPQRAKDCILITPKYLNKGFSIQPSVWTDLVNTSTKAIDSNINSCC